MFPSLIGLVAFQVRTRGAWQPQRAEGDVGRQETEGQGEADVLVMAS